MFLRVLGCSRVSGFFRASRFEVLILDICLLVVGFLVVVWFSELSSTSQSKRNTRAINPDICLLLTCTATQQCPSRRQGERREDGTPRIFREVPACACAMPSFAMLNASWSGNPSCRCTISRLEHCAFEDPKSCEIEVFGLRSQAKLV